MPMPARCVDPADGVQYAGTHYGLFRIPESGPAVRVADRLQDTMGCTVVGPRPSWALATRTSAETPNYRPGSG